MPQQIPISAQAKTLPISVTATASTSVALPGVGDTIVIFNEGPNHAFVSIGTAAQTATLPNATPTATSTPVLAGEDVAFTIPSPQGSMDANRAFTQTPLQISAICRASGTAILDVQVTEGV